jgi:hypothetical protein
LCTTKTRPWRTFRPATPHHTAEDLPHYTATSSSSLLLNPSSDFPVSSLCFQTQLVPLRHGARAVRDGARKRPRDPLHGGGGAVQLLNAQLLNSVDHDAFTVCFSRRSARGAHRWLMTFSKLVCARALTGASGCSIINPTRASDASHANADTKTHSSKAPGFTPLNL